MNELNNIKMTQETKQEILSTILKPRMNLRGFVFGLGTVATAVFLFVTALPQNNVVTSEVATNQLASAPFTEIAIAAEESSLESLDRDVKDYDSDVAALDSMESELNTLESN